MNRPPNPTLLVFTLGAVRERALHSLVPEELKDLEIGLRQSCLDAALAAGRACGCRLEVCSPSPRDLPEEVLHVPQQGSSFGSRLDHAVEEAFARGGSPLLVVGTDVPGLSARHLAQALALMADDPEGVVLGPSPDGGLYLLAASRPLPGLAAVRWCRRDTLRSLLKVLRAAGREVVLLEPLADLDRASDLEGWLAARPCRDERWSRLSRALGQVLADRRRPLIPERLGSPRVALTSASAGRSPPLVLAF
jgi:uncharacterized protein DUF2064